jgi:hypothetical protein
MSMKFDRATFEKVFSDAHVIDVDLSEWDKQVALWTLADHYEDWTHRCPIVVVEFRGVREFTCRMPPPEAALESPDEHLQWNVDDFELHVGEHSMRVRLFGSTYSPSLTVEFEAISFRSFPSELLDQSFPGWNRPYSALARPTIDKLADLARGSGKRGRNR